MGRREEERLEARTVVHLTLSCSRNYIKIYDGWACQNTNLTDIGKAKKAVQNFDQTYESDYKEKRSIPIENFSRFRCTLFILTE